ncbi:MAG: hypothetical protein Q4C34_04085 [Bacteroidales bacterium]|nr:hypothetical protein [Bacteroidales bacterium]
MSLVNKVSGETVDVGQPDSKKQYFFDTAPGKYILTAYGTDATTVNGTIEIFVGDSVSEQVRPILTNTVYTNTKHEDGSYWSVANGDFTIDLTVRTREGESEVVTMGDCVGKPERSCFLAMVGNTYYITFKPSATHIAEGYGEIYKSGTLNFNVNVSATIPKAKEFTVTVPKEASFELNRKTSHFIDFINIPWLSEDEQGDNKVYTYRISVGETYNFRTSLAGGLTQGGYMLMSADSDGNLQVPELKFSRESYAAFPPNGIKHSVQENTGFETGDIFVNINAANHLSLRTGETYKAHAMRTWQLTENTTNNYFIEPDFHYTVLDLNGRPCDNILKITQKPGSAWADIEAIGQGEAIVLVTYDAISLNWFNKKWQEYLGGAVWGAIWPENTAAYVVSVGQNESAVKPNFFINTGLNEGKLKVAGDNVDSEHDVFYYLDTEEGAYYTFTPENVANITIAYPTVSETAVAYNGFGSDGVTANQDGSYTLLLKEGRQIVRLEDASGNAVYQVLTAKKCHQEIINASRPGSRIFQPGDDVKVIFSGLRHPANKLAGIYNMSAYVTYNGTPNGTALILSANQYQFGSSEKAQTVEFHIPTDHNIAEKPVWVMDEGVLQVNGYGDPIGNHRIISPVTGRNPNFTAVAHKTYFGMVPPARIPLTAVRDFPIVIQTNVEDPEIKITFAGTELTPDSEGRYSGTYGTYNVTVIKDGYIIYRNDFDIDDNAEGTQTFACELSQGKNTWDGKTLTEPALVDGIYQISNAEELAWFADHVNTTGQDINGILTDDIELGGHDWTPIGLSTAKKFRGVFNGDAHAIHNLYINTPTGTYKALFGYVGGEAKVMNFTVDGAVRAKQYAAGVACNVSDHAIIDRIGNYVKVNTTSGYCAGVVYYAGSANAQVSNCYNAADITGTNNVAGVIGGGNAATPVSNVYNIGTITGTGSNVGAVIANASTCKIENAYAIKEANNVRNEAYIDEAEVPSGALAYKLGDAFGQELGKDRHPVIGGAKVYYDADNGNYSNQDPNTVGIGSISLDDDTAGDKIYYNPQGISSDKPFRGINIVRHANGTVTREYHK